MTYKYNKKVILMSFTSFVLCVFNIFFAIISFVPCLMGGVMGMASPQAQKDPLSIILCILFLTFPLVCLICGFLCPILNHFKWNIAAVVLGLFPILEAVSVISAIAIWGEK